MRIFSAAEIHFIQENIRQEPAKLMLQASRYPGLPVQELVLQIQARQKALSKLPLWANNPDIVFPVMVSVEQSSSEATASFKATLLKGKVLIDLTGGFGVDSFFFSRSFEKVIHLEQNTALQDLANYNFNVLGATNIESKNTSAEAFLNQYQEQADLVYLDPARRSGSNEKLHQLQDCEPDVLNLLPLLFQKAKAVLLKTSPMLDIELAVEQLAHVSKVWVVALQNEVKEVLYLLQPDALEPDQIERHAVNLLPNKENQEVRFTKATENAAQVRFADPMAYIYEPNAAILKSGAFRTMAVSFNLAKLHSNSHLYTSNQLIPDFPGRQFECKGVYRYSKKDLLPLLLAKKANITVRNFPDSVAEIRKKTGIKEGGHIYLFFTTDMHQKPIVLACEKVN